MRKTIYDASYDFCAAVRQLGKDIFHDAEPTLARIVRSINNFLVKVRKFNDPSR